MILIDIELYLPVEYRDRVVFEGFELEKKRCVGERSTPQRTRTSHGRLKHFCYPIVKIGGHFRFYWPLHIAMQVRLSHPRKR